MLPPQRHPAPRSCVGRHEVHVLVFEIQHGTVSWTFGSVRLQHLLLLTDGAKTPTRTVKTCQAYIGREALQFPC